MRRILSNIDTRDNPHSDSLLECTKISWRPKRWHNRIIRSILCVSGMESCFIFFTPEEVSQRDAHREKCLRWKCIIFRKLILISERCIIITKKLDTLDARYTDNMYSSGCRMERSKQVRNSLYFIIARILVCPIIIPLERF